MWVTSWRRAGVRYGGHSYFGWGAPLPGGGDGGGLELACDLDRGDEARSFLHFVG
jgi:hypothetical protein